MSKVKDCPKCKAHNCVNDTCQLNYCAWCGYKFPDNKVQKENVKITQPNGQLGLF